MNDFHFVQNIDNSRVVRLADPRRRREQRTIFASVAVLFLLLFGYAWQNYRMIRLGYSMEDVRQQEAGLSNWNRALSLEQASLRDPVRIYTLAEDRLGLQSARPGQIARLEPAPAMDAVATPVLAEARAPFPPHAPAANASQPRSAPR